MDQQRVIVQLRVRGTEDNNILSAVHRLLWLCLLNMFFYLFVLYFFLFFLQGNYVHHMNMFVWRAHELTAVCNKYDKHDWNKKLFEGR